MPFWKLKIEKSITKSCLLFGHSFQFTSKKVTQYLLGTRETTEIFKLYELRYLLLKIYPLIHNLFHNPRNNLRLKFQTFWNLPGLNSARTLKFSSSTTKTKIIPSKVFEPFKNGFSFIVKRKNVPPQILFASVTPSFSDIISNAAQICNMPWHTNRWLSGSITAAISYPSDKLIWQYLQDLTQKNVFQSTFAQWGHNKENEEKIKEKIEHYKKSRWPSLIIVPDISNNTMILKEARKVGLPVIGLVNSNCLLEIDYPIFAQEETQQSVHFFCHFLAILIAKEAVFLQHKRYTLQKALQKVVQKIDTPKLTETKKKGLPFKNLKTFIELQKIKEPWKKPFFFKIILPWRKRISKRYLLTKKIHKFHPLLSNDFFKPKKKGKKFSPYLNISSMLSKNSLSLRKQLPWKLSRKKKIKKMPKNFFFETVFTEAGRTRISSGTRGTRISSGTRGTRISSGTRGTTKLYMDWYLSKNSKTLKQKNYSPVRDVENNSFLFKNEYKRKILQKNKQKIFPNQEKKQIFQKLRNFLWFSKTMHRLKIYRKFFPKTFPFATTSYYFRNSLQQWSQHFKWRDHPVLVKSVLKIKLHTEKEEDKNWRYNYLPKKNDISKNKYKHRVQKRSPKNTWKMWAKQHYQCL